MSSAIATLSEPHDSDAQAWDAAGDGCAPPSRERRLRMLDRLAEAGMELVEGLVAQGKGTGPKVVDGDVGLAFSRVSRGVRLAVLLQEQLSGPGEDPEDAARQAEAGRRKAHIGRAVRIVERVAKDHCRKTPGIIAACAYEARERLDDDDIYGLVTSRPVGELVALICRDFGLEPNWDALAQEAWAQAEMASGAPGSPFLDDGDDEEEDEDPEPGPEPPVCRPRTLQDRLDFLAHDPDILAAARRDTG
jgi:hypothetical protein